MSIPKRKIEEIRVRYELEPDLDDLYLEGTIDKEIMDSALRAAPDLFRPCYTIDDIDVGAELLAQYGLTSGNRQRVIVLAGELTLAEHTKVRLLVDRDFEDWLPTLPKLNGLITTKFCDVETVFFKEEFTKKILLDASRCKIKDWNNFFDSIKTCLSEIFALRLEIVASGLNTGLIDFTRCLKIVDELPQLDLHSLSERSLSSSSTKEDRNALLQRTIERLPLLRQQPHQFISRGHDFTKMLSWCVRSTGGLKAFQNEDTLSRLFVLFAKDENEDLLEPIQ